MDGADADGNGARDSTWGEAVCGDGGGLEHVVGGENAGGMAGGEGKSEGKKVNGSGETSGDGGADCGGVCGEGTTAAAGAGAGAGADGNTGEQETLRFLNAVCNRLRKGGSERRRKRDRERDEIGE